MKREIRTYFEMKENITYQNLCDAAKTVLIEKFIALKVYIGKKGWS